MRRWFSDAWQNQNPDALRDDPRLARELAVASPHAARPRHHGRRQHLALGDDQISASDYPALGAQLARLGVQTLDVRMWSQAHALLEALAQNPEPLALQHILLDDLEQDLLDVLMRANRILPDLIRLEVTQENHDLRECAQLERDHEHDEQLWRPIAVEFPLQ